MKFSANSRIGAVCASPFLIEMPEIVGIWTTETAWLLFDRSSAYQSNLGPMAWEIIHSGGGRKVVRNALYHCLLCVNTRLSTQIARARSSHIPKAMPRCILGWGNHATK